MFSPGDPDRYASLVQNLIEDDKFMVASDFDSYAMAQEASTGSGAIPPAWWRASILNTAGIGWFSSDRTIAEYAERDLGHPNRHAVNRSWPMAAFPFRPRTGMLAAV